MMRGRSLMLRTAVLFLLFAVWALAPVQACYFVFNHEQIHAPLGTTGIIAVRVLMDHSDCSLEGGIDGMEFSWSRIQVIESTAWQEIGSDLFERSFRVTLSQVGSGFFRIFKDCDREGYEQLEMPIIIQPGGQVWEDARSGRYPYSSETSLGFLKDRFAIGGSLTTEAETIDLPHLPSGFPDGETDMAVFYSTTDGNKSAVLVAGADFYFRF